MVNRIVFGRILTLLLIGSLLSVLSACSVKANVVERKVGVKAGDWVEYSCNATFYSDDPEQLYYASITGTYIELEIEGYLVTVVTVSGTNITYRGLTRFKNGTEKELPLITFDVNGTNGWIFVSANLTVGDTLLPYVYVPPPWVPYSPPVLRINETIYSEYLGEIREINHVNTTETEDHNYPPKYISFYASLQQYYDRATGVPVEITCKEYLVANEGYVTNASRSWRIVDTNIWGPHITPEFNTVVYILSLIMITTTVSTICFRQKKKQQT